jgi:hypothetical protein
MNKRDIRPEGRRETSTPRQERPGHVDPSKLKASELRALVAMLKNRSQAVTCDGHAFTGTLIFRFSVVVKLLELGLLYRYPDRVELTRSGQGIARIFEKRPILGYD